MIDIKKTYERIGFPRLIIIIFILVLLVTASFLKIPLSGIYSEILVRFGMNAILVLAMVPAINSGIGLNFNLPLGVIFGLLGSLISLELGLTGWNSLFLSLFISIPTSAIAGYAYGVMLNKVKGQEMTVGNYIGFSVVSFMCIIWALIPFKSPELVWAMSGTGLRTTISLENSMEKILDNLLSFKFAGMMIPTGLLIVMFLFCFLMYLYSRSKSGLAMAVSGSNPKFAESNGVNVDKQRIKGTVLSTVLGAIGIIIYSQSFGFLQLYNAPLYVAMPAVASILIGGATIERAKISHVLIGTLLFQSVLVIALPVINVISEGSMSEIVRIIISNGIILYALTRSGGDA